MAVAGKGKGKVHKRHVRQKTQEQASKGFVQAMEKTTGVFMIATVIALLIGAIIGVGTLVLFAMLLAHVQNVDNPPDWINSRPSDSLDADSPNKPQEAQESPYPK